MIFSANTAYLDSFAFEPINSGIQVLRKFI